MALKPSEEEPKRKADGSSGNDNNSGNDDTSYISTDQITAFAAIAALIVAIIIAWKQISIQHEQTEIAKKQTEIARQQLDILDYQEQERRKEKGKAELKAQLIKRDVPNEVLFQYLLRIKK